MLFSFAAPQTNMALERDRVVPWTHPCPGHFIAIGSRKGMLNQTLPSMRNILQSYIDLDSKWERTSFLLVQSGK